MWFDQNFEGGTRGLTNTTSVIAAYMKEEQERKEKAKGEAGEGSAVRS